MMNVTGMCVIFVALLTMTIASLDDVINNEIIGNSVSCPANNEVENNILQQLRERLVSKNSKLLVQFLISDCSPKDTEILQFANFLASVYDEALVKAIYCEVVDMLYTQKNTEIVAAYIWKLYRKGNMISFKLMLEAQLYLFAKFMKRGGIRDGYLLNVGYYFYKAKHDELFEKLESRLRDDITVAIERLPSTLQFFYFKDDFCLFNKGYDEYLYMAEGIFFDSNRRYLFTWIPAGGEMSQGAWHKWFSVTDSESEVYTGQTPFTVALKGKKYGKFMYMDGQNDNLVLAWEPGFQPPNAVWSLQFIEGALVFEQNDFLLCASHRVDQFNERRYIYGYNDEKHRQSNKYCQWAAVHCPLEN